MGQEYGVREFNIDSSYGSATCDLLKANNFTGVNEVFFGEKASNQEIYINKRAEMYDRLSYFINRGKCRIPKGKEVLEDLAMIPEIITAPSSGRLQVESKDKIRKAHNNKSPDIVDAMALTFYIEDP